MADPKSYIGANIALSASTPSTIDASGFGALTYTTVGKVVSVSAIGDTSNDISATTLAGRVFHQNGAADGGTVNFEILYDNAGDAGAQLALAQNNSNTIVSAKITDPDGKITYFYGVIANFQDKGRDAQTIKGFTFATRVNSTTIRPSF